MKSFIFAVSMVGIFFSSSLLSQNKYPIVLVPGFMGWGTDEMGPYMYWGGWHNLVQELEEEGFTVIVASVGPVSSSWDRAIELFYLIKGGQIDYGKGHSNKFDLIQNTNFF